MLTVACVYKSGGDFDERYVVALARGLRRHLHVQFGFQCLTDRVEEVAGALSQADVFGFAIPLRSDWQGWFSKIEMFSIPGPVLYFDLDTVVVGDVTPLSEWITESGAGLRLLMLRDFYRPHVSQTGIMGWNESAGLEELIGMFDREARSGSWIRVGSGRVYLNSARGERFDGDAEWLRPRLNARGRELAYAQDLMPGVVSYKDGVEGNRMMRAGDEPRCSLPAGMRLVCFHGRPRPSDVASAPWMQEHWKGSSMRLDGLNFSEDRQS